MEFEIASKGMLIEMILSSNAVYLQSGRLGERLKDDPNAPKIVAEVAATGFRPIWDKLFLKHLVREMKKEGLNRQQAKQAATAYIQEMRAVSQIRIK